MNDFEQFKLEELKQGCALSTIIIFVLFLLLLTII